MLFKQNDVLTIFMCFLAFCGTNAKIGIQVNMENIHSDDAKIVKPPVSAYTRKMNQFHIESRIIGGSETVKGRYPYMAEINFSLQDPGPILGNHNCGGLLITPNVVLTARSCLDDPGLESFQIVLGAFKLDEIDNDADIEIFNITNLTASVIGNPVQSSDLALVYLDEDSTKTPVQLNFDNSLPDTNQKVTAIGWGFTSDAPPNSNVLRQVELDVISNSACSAIVVEITDQTLCTQTIDKDVCTNDIGGPLIIPGEEAAQDVLFGIVSSNEGCGFAIFPSVSSRVSTAIEWIDQNAPLPTNSPSSRPSISPSKVSSKPTFPVQWEATWQFVSDVTDVCEFASDLNQILEISEPILSDLLMSDDDRVTNVVMPPADPSQCSQGGARTVSFFYEVVTISASREQSLIPPGGDSSLRNLSNRILTGFPLPAETVSLMTESLTISLKTSIQQITNMPPPNLIVSDPIAAEPMIILLTPTASPVSKGKSGKGKSGKGAKGGKGQKATNTPNNPSPSPSPTILKVPTKEGKGGKGSKGKSQNTTSAPNTPSPTISKAPPNKVIVIKGKGGAKKGKKAKMENFRRLKLPG